MAIDRDKYRRLFIDEAREGLAQIGNELVELEKAAKAGGVDVGGAAKGRFDAVFRHAHSLKGMGAAMGYNRFAILAHRLEDLADLGRAGQTLPQEAFDLLLEGCDVLEECVDAVSQGAEDPDAKDLAVRAAALVEKLKPTATTTTTTAPVPAAAPAPPAPVPAAASSAGGRGSVVLRVRIAPDATLPLVRAFVVHRTLSGMPGWIDTQPPPEALRQKELPEFMAQRILTVRFAAGTDPTAVIAAAKGAQGVADVVVEAEAEAAPPEKEDKKAANVDDDRTVRVRTALLDDLIDSVGEVLLARSRLRVLAARLDEPELNDLVDEVDRLTRELHTGVVAARMTPLSFMAERLPRVVRDLARQQQKTVDFTMTGMDIELDRAILDELQAPLIHMLRNAVDHGHEGNAVRTSRGRPAVMKLALRAVRDRDRVLLELQDDGKGMDPARVRQKAVEKGLIDKARADALSPEQSLELVCLPGFSTADSVTETSGRGVGMDVVKATLDKLGGALRLASAAGQGTTLTLELPLTVAIIQVLVVDVGATGDGYVIPVARVERALAVEEAAVSVASGRSFLRVGERLLPLFDLAALLGLRDARSMTTGTAILVAAGASLAAFRVDRILGQEEVVAKPLGAPLSALSYVAGGAILADGRAAFLLEPQRLLDDDGLRGAGASLVPQPVARVG
ncbi:MAG: chemotaxis protein CheA [Deltaproteobacteria bacterium]|nr:chemotaxis protein CheA [Deltaproteobacteria bacterium]